MFYKDEKLAVLIDGPNTFYCAKQLGIMLDYKKLRAEFQRRGKLSRVFYFTAIPETDDHNPMRPLMDWMQYNGFVTVTKPLREYEDFRGNPVTKGDMTVEFVVTALREAEHADHIVLFTGDGNYRALVAELQLKGVRVTVVSSKHPKSDFVSAELRAQADQFIDLADLKDTIGKPLQHHNTAAQ